MKCTEYSSRSESHFSGSFAAVADRNGVRHRKRGEPIATEKNARRMKKKICEKPSKRTRRQEGLGSIPLLCRRIEDRGQLRHFIRGELANVVFADVGGGAAVDRRDALDECDTLGEEVLSVAAIG